MPVLTAADVARMASGSLTGDPQATATGIWSDSRAMPAGFAFAAIRVGHDYVREVSDAGAPFVIVDRPEAADGLTSVGVDDVEKALARIATAVRLRDALPAVGVTGSTGKTLTKDLLAAALRAKFKVHASPASFNNELGVPLTILSAPSDAEVLVLELAARGPGQIDELALMARPTVGVLTGIGWTHMEVFGDRETIAETKAELLASLPADGTAVVYAGDDYLDLFSSVTAARIRTVGPGGQARASSVKLDSQGRAQVKFVLPDGQAVAMTVPVAGRALVRNAGLALTVAWELGVDAQAAADAIGQAPTSAWRMQVANWNGRTIVNDAYNANPTSMASALRTVREMAADKPAVAVLGQMAELGESAPIEHLRMGRLAAALGFSKVVAVGTEAAEIAAGAGSVGVTVETVEDAAAMVASTDPGTFALLKGSRVVGLERIPALLDDPKVSA